MTRLLAALTVRPTDPDRTLLGRWADARDEAAFAELVRRHGPTVWGVCRRQLANPADAEDAFQAAFLVLARRADAVPGCVGAWLHRVAVLTCRNVRRANRRRPTAALPADIPVSPPADRLEVDDLLNRLPERDRRAVVLCHLLGFTRTEAAKELGVPEGTLSARLSRGLARLRGAEAALAVAAVPAGLATAVERAVGVWELSAAGLSPAATGAASGVLRMFWVKKLTAAAVVLAAVVAGGLGVAMTADQPPAAQPKPVAAEKLPPLAGRWAVIDADLSYGGGRTEFIATLTEMAVAGVAGDGLDWKPGEFQREGRRVRFSATRADGAIVERVEAVQVLATPDRMTGSLWKSPSVRRVELRRLAAGEEPPTRKPSDLPPARKEWLDLVIKAHHAVAVATAPKRKTKPADEQAKLVAAAVDAQTKLTDAEPRLLRTLVADEPNTVHGFDAARELIHLAGWNGRSPVADRVNAELDQKPGTVRVISKVDATPEEVRSWVGIVRRFAATHGPQLEAGAVARAARELLQTPKFFAYAGELAAEADKLATAAGLPPTAGDLYRQHKEEADAWATQKNPLAADSVWTASVRGRVTDAAGKPVPGAKVVVNGMQWVQVLIDDKSNEVTADADGRYTATIRCKGQRRLHVTGMWAEAIGHVKAANGDRHKLLPGQAAEVNFTLAPGEKFAGRVELPAEQWNRLTGGGKHSVTVRGMGVEEWLVLANGERFELYLPPGEYTVTLDGFGGEKQTWADKPTGTAEHTLTPPPGS